MVEFFRKGGIMMWGLLFLAVIGLIFIIERLITLLIQARLNPRKFVDKLISEIEKGGIKAGKKLCDETAAPVAKILAAGLAKVERGKEVVEDAITADASVELAFLDRGMIYLSMVSTLAPILGFLGTVSGMIGAFEAIARVGEVEPTVVASGISEALITTATGLTIAAPVVLFYAIFSSKIDAYSRDMEQSANMLVEYLVEKKLIKG